MKWYLLQTKPRQDEVAECNLRRQGYDCFRPLHFVEKLLSGKISVKQESLFPGYMFVRLADSQNWSPIRSTFGVRCLVRFGETPVTVPYALIDELKARTINRGVTALLKPGQQVLIKDGVFAGLNAVFCSKCGDNRVMLLLDILQRSQQVAVPMSAIVV